MVQRGSTQANGTARLKPAAVMTETGDLRQIMSLQWESKSSDNDPFIKKVDVIRNMLVVGLRSSRKWITLFLR